VESRPKSVEHLNELIAIELMAINQYFVHAKMCESWGYERLAKHFWDDSIDEMKDADKLMERVLYFGGLPNLQRLDPFQVGETPKEQLELARDLELSAVEKLHASITACEADGDTGTGTMLREMLLAEQEQVDWVDTQLRMIDTLGEQLYLAQQVHE
jgi:bacterioferritin